MENKKQTIGILGPMQIYHLIPVLEEEYNVINLQKIIDSQTNSFTKTFAWIKHINKCDYIYNVFTSPYFYRKLRIAKFFNKKVITHWIGTDVRVAVEGKTDFSKLKGIKHVVCFEALQDDLKKLGLSADILPITPFNLKFDIAEMPKEHAVIIYMPKGKESDYGYKEIVRVFPKYPNVVFYIVANDDTSKFNYPNVRVLGQLPLEKMEELYNKVSICLRIHISDGLSMSVLEAMAKGKKIIWNCKYPFAYPGSTTEEICNSLDQILKNKPEPDIKAHDFINQEYTKDKFLKMFNSYIESL